MRHTIRVITLLLLTVAAWSPGTAGQAPASKPKLIVVIAVDQMRADYPVRYAGLLEHGLKQLTTEGAWFKNAAYPYLNTVTCAGHSSIGTGTFPYKHGMVLNAWYDRQSGKTLACTEDPSTSEVAYGNFAGPGDSPKNIKMPSLAEFIHKNKGRVATMSIKARSAIGLAGHEADSVAWLDERGAWETSTFYTKTPIPWLTAFIKGNPLDRDAGKTWERTLPADRYQYADDAPGERGAAGWSSTFPHPLGITGDKAFLPHWLQSPFADAYLEQMAEAAIDDMKLGQESRTDFLGVSFSALDAVGHGFGPRSHEVQDILVRLDATLEKLIQHLDKKVGRENYVLGLSADHGVADIPEQVNGGRQSGPQIIAAIEEALKPIMGNGPFVAASAYTDIYLSPAAADRVKTDKKAMAAVNDSLMKLPGIARVIRADELASPHARDSDDPQLRAAAFSYFAGRSGDIILIPKENWLLAATSTTHGTLYPYDQRVPVILFGAGIQPGQREEAVTPADLTATLATLAGVKLPSPDGHPLKEALK
jgi:predicted AlkP superfamily pyrophosphatase or phosphodiesterase